MVSRTSTKCLTCTYTQFVLSFNNISSDSFACRLDFTDITTETSLRRTGQAIVWNVTKGGHGSISSVL